MFVLNPAQNLSVAPGNVASFWQRLPLYPSSRSVLELLEGPAPERYVFKTLRVASRVPKT